MKRVFALLFTTSFGIPFCAGAVEPAGLGEGDILLRARVLVVAPDVGSSVSKVGGDVAISENTVPEIDATYFLTDHVGLELIAGTTYHDVRDKNSAAGTIPLGSVRLLPPTLTAQWHFAPREIFDPYAGAGINYTFFYGAKYSGPIIQSIHYSDSAGVALQAGADIRVSDRFFLNVDVKKLFLSTDVKLGTVVGPVSAKVAIDPWLIGFGFGYRL